MFIIAKLVLGAYAIKLNNWFDFLINLNYHKNRAYFYFLLEKTLYKFINNMKLLVLSALFATAFTQNLTPSPVILAPAADINLHDGEKLVIEPEII